MHDAAVEATVGSYDLLEGRAFINAPFNDQLAGRLAVTHSEHDGYALNTFTGHRVEAADVTSVRGALRYDPNEDVSVILRANGSWNRDFGGARDPNPCGPTCLARFSNSALGNIPFDPDPRRVQGQRDGYFDRDLYGTSANIGWKSPIGQFTSITGFMKRRLGASGRSQRSPGYPESPGDQLHRRGRQTVQSGVPPLQRTLRRQGQLVRRPLLFPRGRCPRGKHRSLHLLDGRGLLRPDLPQLHPGRHLPERRRLCRGRVQAVRAPDHHRRRSLFPRRQGSDGRRPQSGRRDPGFQRAPALGALRCQSGLGRCDAPSGCSLQAR